MYFINRLNTFIIVLLYFKINSFGNAAVSTPNPHTCIIGGGYSGLAAARYLKQFGVNFTVFEASRYVGGTWRFDPHVGLDDDGIPVFTSMYKYLRTNTPRQTMEFGGYPFPDKTPSYPTGTCFYKYIKSFVKQFDLMPNVQVGSLVTAVRYVNDHWELTYSNTDDRNSYTVNCDNVVVANGQYVNPAVPKLPGINTFEGTMIHSHDYKEPEVYKDRKVLLVGAGASGLDLATQLHNITAKLVHSHHLTYNQPDFAKQYIKKSDIKAFVPNGVVFEDDSFEEVEDVIFCTGYEYKHSFLDSSSGLTITGKYVLPLHQSIVNIRRPSMTFIGVVKTVITKTMDAQAEYIASLIAGKFELPSQEDMLKNWLSRAYKLQTRGKKITDVNLIGSDMDNYFETLTKEAGIARVAPVLSDIRDFNAANRLEDLLNYRDYDYEIIDPYKYTRMYNGGGSRGQECPVEN